MGSPVRDPRTALTHHRKAETDKMTRSELQVRLESLEELFDEITALLDDPEVGEGELRHELRELLEENDDDE